MCTNLLWLDLETRRVMIEDLTLNPDSTLDSLHRPDVPRAARCPCSKIREKSALASRSPVPPRCHRGQWDNAHYLTGFTDFREWVKTKRPTCFPSRTPSRHAVRK